MDKFEHFMKKSPALQYFRTQDADYRQNGLCAPFFGAHSKSRKVR